jgi:hypothetical protein
MSYQYEAGSLTIAGALSLLLLPSTLDVDYKFDIKPNKKWHGLEEE